MEIEYFVIFKSDRQLTIPEYSFVEKPLLDELIASGHVDKYYETTHKVHTREEISDFLTKYVKGE